MEPFPGLVDTHVHLDRLPGPEAPALQAEEARRAGVAAFVVPGVAPRDWERLLAVCARIPGAYPAPGLHPATAGEWNARSRERLAALLGRGTAVAVGEIGLDDTPGMPPAAVQERALVEQLQLALAHGRPVLLHCRRATGRLLAILDQEGVGRIGGILHAFSGSWETARRVLDLNLVVGIGGPVTFPNARRLPEVLRRLPEDGFVLETDAPDLPPHPFRQQPNRPCRLAVVAARVAVLRGWTPARTARVTTATAQRVLGLPVG